MKNIGYYHQRIIKIAIHSDRDFRSVRVTLSLQLAIFSAMKNQYCMCSRIQVKLLWPEVVTTIDDHMTETQTGPPAGQKLISQMGL